MTTVEQPMTTPYRRPWWIVPANDKKRARLGMMQHFLASLPYEGKDPKIVKGPDPLIVGDSAHVLNNTDHILGKSLHPKQRKQNEKRAFVVVVVVVVL